MRGKLEGEAPIGAASSSTSVLCKSKLHAYGEGTAQRAIPPRKMHSQLLPCSMPGRLAPSQQAHSLPTPHAPAAQLLAGKRLPLLHRRLLGSQPGAPLVELALALRKELGVSLQAWCANRAQ